MAEEKKDEWIRWIALSTAALAVLAAITTLYLGKFSGRAVLKQGEETDQWAYYQSKSIKQYTFEVQRNLLELEFERDRARMSPALSKKYQGTINKYNEQIARYGKEKKEIEDEARAIQKDKKLSGARAAQFGYSVIFLQIAIVLSSVSALTRKKYLWYVGLVAALFGIFFFVNGFQLFFGAPVLEVLK
jgi:hypothetical protein